MKIFNIKYIRLFIACITLDTAILQIIYIFIIQKI
jgi:hypothetical protein